MKSVQLWKRCVRSRVIDFAMRATRGRGSVLVLGVCVRERAAGRSDRLHEPGALTAAGPG